MISLFWFCENYVNIITLNSKWAPLNYFVYIASLICYLDFSIMFLYLADLSYKKPLLIKIKNNGTNPKVLSFRKDLEW